jgi:hypothetical protein
MPIFSLEAFQAEQDDCFLLHFGANEGPRFLVVDGGPGSKVYEQRLKPRLSALAQRFGPFELPLAVCSHIDSDHIGGVLALMEEVAWGAPPARVACLWHNRPLDLVGEDNPERFAAIVREVPESDRYATVSSRYFSATNWEVDAALMHVVASVEEGDKLYDAAQEAGVAINCGFDGLVMAPTAGAGYATAAIDDLRLTVIGPDAGQIDALRGKWKKETTGVSLDELCSMSKRVAAVVAADDDHSVTNLSSIVFLAEYQGRTCLFTGDAHGHYIRNALGRAGRLQGGQARVDILKLQHHGSARTADEEFFATVIADDYVISANGRYGDPDEATIDALVAARGQENYRVWLTNGDTGTALAAKVTTLRSRYPKLDLEVRPASQESQLIDLADPVGY